MRARLVAAGELRLMEQLARELDHGYVRELRRALRRDDELPPLVVDQEDGVTVVDGAHRLTAIVAELGKDARVKVHDREFEDEAERLVFALESMLVHGRRATPQDEARIFRRLELDHGWPVERIATRFHFDPKDVLSRLGRTVNVSTSDGIRPLYLKAAVRSREALDLAGHGTGGVITLTDDAVALLARATGMSTGLHVRQLADLYNLGEAFWPKPTRLILDHLPAAIAFLEAYRDRHDQHDEGHAAA